MIFPAQTTIAFESAEADNEAADVKVVFEKKEKAEPPKPNTAPEEKNKAEEEASKPKVTHSKLLKDLRLFWHSSNLPESKFSFLGTTFFTPGSFGRPS